jgi:putative flippase GtrA
MLHEAIKYGAVSGCALVVDVAGLFVLVHYFSWWYVAAASASFLVGLLLGYLLSITVVFKYRRLQDARIEFASFAAIGVVGLGINATAISIGVRFFGLHYLIAKCGAAGFTFLWNFVARRQLLFVKRRHLNECQ